MRRTALTLLATASLAACGGGDTTPLPPITVGPEWFELMLDTTPNFVMRRVGMWVDTAHVTALPSGYLQASQKMVMDLKLGGVSTRMQMRTEFDCAGRRYRVTGMDSLAATVKGKPMSDADAQKAAAGQSQAMQDTTWRAVAESDKGASTMLAAICAKGSAPPAASAPDSAAKK